MLLSVESSQLVRNAEGLVQPLSGISTGSLSGYIQNEKVKKEAIFMISTDAEARSTTGSFSLRKQQPDEFSMPARLSFS